jgi:ATP-dependent protease ClpP protease subunit
VFDEEGVVPALMCDHFMTASDAQERGLIDHVYSSREAVLEF